MSDAESGIPTRPEIPSPLDPGVDHAATADRDPFPAGTVTTPDAAIIDSAIVRRFAAAALVWAVAVMVLGMLVGLIQLLPESVAGLPALGYGRMRPVHTNLAVYGFLANATFALMYHSTQRLCGRAMFSGGLSRMHFYGWQCVALGAAVVTPFGITQGKPLGETEWWIDAAAGVVWLLFTANFIATLRHRSVPSAYISLWFYTASAVAVPIVLLTMLAVDVVTASTSVPAAAGAGDAALHWFGVHNLMLFLGTVPLMGAMYHYVPLAAGRPLASYPLAVVHFWTLTLIGVWVSPRYLHYTPLPEWIQSTGMIFNLMWWMPTLAGVVNGLSTLRRGGQLFRGPGLYFTAALAAYAVYCTAGFLAGIKSLDATLRYTDVVLANRHLWMMGWVTLSLIGGLLVIRSRRLAMLEESDDREASARHMPTWIGIALIVGLVAYVVPLYVSGFIQADRWFALDEVGNLRHPEFITSVTDARPWRLARLFGGGVYLAAFVAAGWWLVRQALPSRTIERVRLTASGAIESAPRAPRHDLRDAPVLEAARRLQSVTNLAWHTRYERHPGRFGWLAGGVLAIAIVFQTLPAVIYGGVIDEANVAGVLTPLEAHGRRIYVREGCVQCHTQNVRPLVAESKRYGIPTTAADVPDERPHQWGHRRVGPDLGREGGRQTSLWHWQHLEDPRFVNDASLMPRFAHLSRTAIDLDAVVDFYEDTSEAIDDVLETDGGDGSDNGDEIERVIRDEIVESVRAQAQAVAADVVSQGGPLSTGGIMTFDSETIALIAYLQRLGTQN